MNILVLGGGGREHALVWAFRQNPKCDTLFAAPGNAGIAEHATCLAADPTDGDAVLDLVRKNDIDFVVVGPEAPLVAGVADTLRAQGILTLGPSRAAAALEASKAFTKDVCDAAGAPTARWARFDDAPSARAYVAREGAPIVVKADGLAAGKGVTVAEREEDALAAIDEIFAGKFGAAGASLVIEECLTGEEASLFVLCDGETALPIGTAQDHKRAFDGDTGPNTGGMGAYSPAPIMTEDVTERAMATIVRPTLEVMRARGTPFEGILYTGLMIEDGAPRLIEYNVRFGDPEMQVLAMRLGGQLLDLCHAAAERRLHEVAVNWADDAAMTVVMAAIGYPGSYAKGSVIEGADAASGAGVAVFHAGTARSDGQLVAAGGRVLAVTARAASLAEARDKAYTAVGSINWPDGFYRKDIGWRALT